MLKKLLPSYKLLNDTQFTYNQVNDIIPVQINEISLTSIMKKKVLNLREKHSKLEITRSLKKMSLIIPYRHREEHLKKFIPIIKEYLNLQNINYEIIIVEQDDIKKFNRAKLMNIGVLHSAKDSEYFVFHDVDLLPENNIDYRFCNHTLKLFNFIQEKDKCKQYGQTIFGGATLVPKSIFFEVNGFSNNYWQWGKEDDDFFMRHLLKGKVPLYSQTGKFHALEHLPSIQRNNTGEYTSNKNILKDNKKSYMKNKALYSKLKRGVLDQSSDGINNINDFDIIFIKEDENIKTVKVSLY